MRIRRLQVVGRGIHRRLIIAPVNTPGSDVQEKPSHFWHR